MYDEGWLVLKMIGQRVILKRDGKFGGQLHHVVPVEISSLIHCSLLRCLGFNVEEDTFYLLPLTVLILSHLPAF